MKRNLVSLTKRKACSKTHRSFSQCASGVQPRYHAPSNEQLKEYTQFLASVIHSWPQSQRDYFISTLHAAQSNPKRNNKYDHLLNQGKIPQKDLQRLDYHKLTHWLPFVYANDIVQIVDRLQDSPTLISIHNGTELVTYDDRNPEHSEFLQSIKRHHHDKMV